MVPLQAFTLIFDRFAATLGVSRFLADGQPKQRSQLAPFSLVAGKMVPEHLNRRDQRFFVVHSQFLPERLSTAQGVLSITSFSTC